MPTQADDAEIAATDPEVGSAVSEERLSGTVKKYMNRSGYGFLIPDGDEDNEVWVHWKQISSDDEWPSLEEGMKVEYTLSTVETGRKAGKKYASNVTLPGGGKISVDSRKVEGKTIIAGDPERFTGTVKMFNIKQGYGFIRMDDEKIEIDGEVIKEEIFFPREEIRTADLHPCVLPDTKVEFAIFQREDKDGEKKYGAAKVALPGGGLITVEEEARRKAFSRFFPDRNRGGGRFGGGGRGRQGGHMGGQQQMMMVPMFNPMMQGGGGGGGGGGGQQMDMNSMMQMWQNMMMMQNMMGGQGGGGGMMPMMGGGMGGGGGGFGGGMRGGGGQRNFNKPGNWECPCGFKTNFKSRTTCYKCGAGR